MMDKIAIVTFYNACNYGAFLQAFALQEYLKENNFDVYFLKMPIKDGDIFLNKDRSSFYSQYEYKKYNRLKNNQDNFKLIEKVDSSFSACIIGSDTVWNMFDPIYGKMPFLVGKEIECKKKISYAASLGQSRLVKILLFNTLKLLPIRRLDSISVRDDKTERFIKILCKKCNRVIDPTFLIDFNLEGVNLEISDRYILVYTYGYSEDEIKAIKRFANKKNCSIVATGSFCEWADKNLAVDSFEWLKGIQGAQYIITSTFHGTVFSIKYNKQFVALTKKSDKVLSVLKEFNLVNRLIGFEDLEEVLDNSIDYTTVNRIKSEKVNYSKKFLYDALRV